MKEHPYTFEKGTKLSSAYTAGRKGLPCPPHTSVRGSAARKAWKHGHDEFVQEQRAAKKA